MEILLIMSIIFGGIFGWFMGNVIADSIIKKPTKTWKLLCIFIAALGWTGCLSAAGDKKMFETGFSCEKYDVKYNLTVSETDGQIDSTRTFKIVKLQNNK